MLCEILNNEFKFFLAYNLSFSNEKDRFWGVNYLSIMLQVFAPQMLIFLNYATSLVSHFILFNPMAAIVCLLFASDLLFVMCTRHCLPDVSSFAVKWWEKGIYNYYRITIFHHFHILTEFRPWTESPSDPHQ